MPLVKLQFKPGLAADGSRYSGAGQWVDGDKVRFRQGAPEKIGGWQRTSSAPAFLGTARALIAWSTLTGIPFLGFGTASKYYLESVGANYDITPIRRSATLANPFSTLSGSTTVTVTDVGHGTFPGDYVTFSGASAVGGLTLNSEYTVVAVPTLNTYTIKAASNASSTATGGGGAVSAKYQVSIGLDTSVRGTGYGVGTWGGVVSGGGNTAWGQSATVAVTTAKLRLWSHDIFGQDLILNPRDAPIYYWAASGGTGTRAVALSGMPGAISVPLEVRQILVTDQDRRLVAFGCTDALTGLQDALLIRWTDAENPVDWAPTDINTAGDLRIPSGSEFISARETKQEILVWADDSLHSLRYVGPPYIYGISRVGASTIAGPNAVAVANDLVFWMGTAGFFRYDGRILPVPCAVHDYVFNNLNMLQADKITAGSNMSYNEVWWFYPSLSAQDNDRYVAYNYVENLWFYGALARTAWLDRVVEDYPRAASPDGHIYYHELGADDGSTNPVSAMSAYIESGPLEIGQGDDFGFASRLIPDVGFRNSTGSPSVTMTLKAQDSAGDNFSQIAANTVTRSATVPVEEFTKQCWFRLRGRALTLRVASSGKGVAWRLGVPRVEVRADGKRG